MPKLDVDRLEYAILAERANLTRIPMVAAYSNYGTKVQDIPREFDAAEQRCRDRGLVNPGGVNDRVMELLGIYSHATVEYDLRFSSKKGAELRVAVTKANKTAVRTVVDGDRIILEPVHPNDLIPALISTLPEHQPARIRPPLSIDLADVRAAMAEASRQGEDPRAIEQGLRNRGVSPANFRKMTQLLEGPRLGLGEAGVTIWDDRGKEHRGDQTIRIIDLQLGRTAVYNSGGQRMFAGADLSTFTRVLGELATKTRRDAMREAQW
ncbi:ESX secretion-associated protein EspG [Saccharopolyspora oryzae]|uniref:ESX secretion-associated protein EspG n=1 Tax=Saccharopolyspora oryzae TaxID=2997343 RepID=A0ABT4VA05_9PSEU|nr:ESX secretion-associated protein EspG [Saccharopolyspora oryzae]MDA3630793.1 ESX secretion-associated protein EspG [Saccharopolyspora oryzae]